MQAFIILIIIGLVIVSIIFWAPHLICYVAHVTIGSILKLLDVPFSSGVDVLCTSIHPIVFLTIFAIIYGSFMYSRYIPKRNNMM